MEPLSFGSTPEARGTGCRRWNRAWLLGFGSFASGCDPLPDPPAERGRLHPHAPANSQSFKTKTRGSALSHESGGGINLPSLAAQRRLNRYRYFADLAEQAVSNVSLGGTVVARRRLIRCASCGPSNRAVCGLPLVRLPSTGDGGAVLPFLVRWFPRSQVKGKHIKPF